MTPGRSMFRECHGDGEGHQEKRLNLATPDEVGGLRHGHAYCMHALTSTGKLRHVFTALTRFCQSTTLRGLIQIGTTIVQLRNARPLRLQAACYS